MAARFVLKKSGKQFMFNLFARNGRIILTSERYKDKAKAKAGIRSVKTNAKVASRFETRTAKNGQPYFVLKARNGEIIGKSEMYSGMTGVKTGIASVQKNAPIAELVDEA